MKKEEALVRLRDAVGLKELLVDLDIGGTSLPNEGLAGLKGEFLAFNGADLTGTDFSMAHLMDCDFKEVEAARSIWDGVQGWQCFFRGSRLDGAVMAGARWAACGFSKVSWRESKLERVRAEESNFSDGIFRDAKIRRCRFESNCDFTRAVFEESDLSGTVFENVRLMEASFAGCTLDGVVFRRCNMAGVRGDLSAAKTEFCTNI